MHVWGLGRTLEMQVGRRSDGERTGVVSWVCHGFGGCIV